MTGNYGDSAPNYCVLHIPAVILDPWPGSLAQFFPAFRTMLRSVATDGNLTASGPNAYGYTAENRLIAAPNGVSISYDPTGRISQLIQGANITRFEHLGSRMIAERNGAGTILRRYVHGPNDDEPVMWYEGAGTSDRRWLHTDERGSVVAVTSSAGITVTVH